METERKTGGPEGELPPSAADGETADAPRQGEAPEVSEADAKPEETVGPASDLKW